MGTKTCSITIVDLEKSVKSVADRCLFGTEHKIDRTKWTKSTLDGAAVRSAVSFGMRSTYAQYDRVSMC